MEELVASQNNTSALLIAHNGLAKLLKGRWPWLVGGVLDAPRLLAQLCSIYGDGLSQARDVVTKPTLLAKRRLKRKGKKRHPQLLGSLMSNFGSHITMHRDTYVTGFVYRFRWHRMSNGLHRGDAIVVRAICFSMKVGYPFSPLDDDPTLPQTPFSHPHYYPSVLIHG